MSLHPHIPPHLSKQAHRVWAEHKRRLPGTGSALSGLAVWAQKLHAHAERRLHKLDAQLRQEARNARGTQGCVLGAVTMEQPALQGVQAGGGAECSGCGSSTGSQQPWMLMNSPVTATDDFT